MINTAILIYEGVELLDFAGHSGICLVPGSGKSPVIFDGLNSSESSINKTSDINIKLPNVSEIHEVRK